MQQISIAGGINNGGQLEVILTVLDRQYVFPESAALAIANTIHACIKQGREHPDYKPRADEPPAVAHDVINDTLISLELPKHGE